MTGCKSSPLSGVLVSGHSWLRNVNTAVRSFPGAYYTHPVPRSVFVEGEIKISRASAALAWETPGILSLFLAVVSFSIYEVFSTTFYLIENMQNSRGEKYKWRNDHNIVSILLREISNFPLNICQSISGNGGYEFDEIVRLISQYFSSGCENKIYFPLTHTEKEIFRS